MNNNHRSIAIAFLVLAAVVISCGGEETLLRTPAPSPAYAAHIPTMTSAVPTRLPTSGPGGPALTEEQGWVEMFASITMDPGAPGANTPAAMQQYVIFHGPNAGASQGMGCQGCYVLELLPNAELVVPAEDAPGGGAVVFHPGESEQYRIRGTLTGETVDDPFLGNMPIFKAAYVERLNVPHTATTGVAPASTQAATVVSEPVTPGEPGPFPYLDDPNTACVIDTLGDVVSCLNRNGWRDYPVEWLPEVSMCADGRMILWAGYDVHIYRGGRFVKSLRLINDWGLLQTVACGSGEGFWVKAGDYIIRFDGTNWVLYSTFEHFGSEGPDLRREIVVAPNGDLWASSPASIGRFSATTGWRIFAKGEGLQEDINIRGLVVDANGTAWAFSQGCRSGGCVGGGALPPRLLKFDGSRWTAYPAPDGLYFNLLQVDRQGRVWIGGDMKPAGGGLLEFYTIDPQSGAFVRQFATQQPSGFMRPALIDRQGRAWVLSGYGVDVYDGTTRTSYRMDNSDLGSNELDRIVLFGDGPQLPPTVQEAPGSVRGQLVDPNGKASYAGLQAELCLSSIPVTYFNGKTPCEYQAFHALTKMDAGGNFLFTGVPAGRYFLAVETAPGDWQQMNEDASTAEQVFEVVAGQETGLGTIELRIGD